MAKLLKLRRGSTSQHSSFTGAEGEVTIDTTKDTAVVHDGAQAGGRPLAREDMSNVSSASIAGQLGTDSIAVEKIAAGTLPSDVKINSANINDGQIVNADIYASAAIAGTKISPNFGSQNVVTTGTLNSGNIQISNDAPSLYLTEGDANPDYQLLVNGGQFRVYDVTNTANRIVVNTDGHVDVTGNLDVGAGVDVTGNITATGTVTSQDITIQDQQPRLNFVDNAGSPNNPDYLFQVDGGEFVLHDSTNGTDKIKVNTDGHIDIPPNCDFGAGIDVTGKVAATGEVEATSLDINGTTSPVQIDHTGGSGMSINRSSKNLTFNANYGAAGTHSAIDTNCTDLRIQTAGNDRLAVNSSGISVTGNMNATGDATINGGITAKGSQEPQIILQDSDTGHTGNSAETGISFRDGAGTQMGIMGFSNSGDSDYYFDTASTGYRMNFRVGGSTTQLEIRGGECNFDSDIILQAGHTVDGRDVAADGTKLDGIESGATADQSGSEIANALKGQTIGNGSDGIHDIYNDDWFRNNNGNEGLYNQATTHHWYSEDSVYWTAAGGTNNGIKFRHGHQGTTRGAVYCNSSNQIGFLNNGLNWSFKVDSSGNAEHYGSVTVNSGDNSSDIYMADADETQRRIHCNSHRIGFLDSSNNWGAYCDNSGNWTAGGNVTAYSDARLKTNVNTINDALSIVGKLRGVSFDWKADGKHSIGVIAQEVEEVLPELVVTNKGVNPATQEIEEIKSVDYGKMVSVLINAINELKAEIDELKGGK